MSTGSYELEARVGRSFEAHQQANSRDEGDDGLQSLETSQSLEPADGGPLAWKVLGGAFMFEAILWGVFMTTPDMCTASDHINRISALLRSLPKLLLPAS